MDFNKYYKTHSDAYGRHPSNWIKKILELKKPPAKILDLGVGQGRNAIYLAKKGYDVTGIDASCEGINQCKKKCEKLGVKMELICQDLNEFNTKK